MGFGSMKYDSAKRLCHCSGYNALGCGFDKLYSESANNTSDMRRLLLWSAMLTICEPFEIRIQAGLLGLQHTYNVMETVWRPSYSAMKIIHYSLMQRKDATETSSPHHIRLWHSRFCSCGSGHCFVFSRGKTLTVAASRWILSMRKINRLLFQPWPIRFVLRSRTSHVRKAWTMIEMTDCDVPITFSF